MIDHLALAVDIHAANVAAGWWTDLATGQSIIETRNRGELMMLVVSELAEAASGLECQDDKLPERRMFDVELADTAIRLYDMIGAEHPKGVFVPHCDGIWMRSVESQLMAAVCWVAEAMEQHRKGRQNQYQIALGHALGTVIAIADAHRVPLYDIIAEKRAYNTTRQDHTIEARQQVGGKAY